VKVRTGLNTEKDLDRKEKEAISQCRDKYEKNRKETIWGQ
jgi:hypothetical protein